MEESMSMMEMEPNIVKAQFIVTNLRIYTLEFDQNIKMKELKTMIQVAAHLKKKNFRLISGDQEYTDYNEESFESLFPNEKLVVFNVQKGEGEEYDESELVLQMNSSCPDHSEKFLLFYCFDCGCSICCDCFTNGKHKGHHIQDKCYYLLSSKFLVQKLFESWSKNPYEEYKISTDLTEYKDKVNNVLFDQLFQMLKEIQNRCNELIDNYNNININSVKNIRDSVRDIKVSCIKVLDELKENYNIKDIVNNNQIFKDFDTAYKELGKAQNEKFRQNLETFKALNQQVSNTVITFIENIYNAILETLRKILNDEQYNSIKNQINEKLVKPADQNLMINFGLGDKNKNSMSLTEAIHNGILNVTNNKNPFC